MNRKHIQILLFFIIVIVTSYPQQNKKPFHPKMIALRDLILEIKDSKNIEELNTSMMDSLVSYFRFQEKLANILKYPQWRSFPPDSAYDWVFPAFDNLVFYSTKDTLYIHTLIRLYSIIRVNAELSEAMPAFVQDAARRNTEGFVKVYKNMTIKEREELTSGFDWGADIDVRKIFTDYANSTNDVTLRKVALEIASSVKVDEFK